MKILFIFRGEKSGPSVRRVFEPIVENLIQKGIDSNSFYLPTERADLWSIMRNVRNLLKHLKGNTYDIIHITGDVYYLLFFLKGYNVITTVHDLGFYTNNKLSVHSILRYLFWIVPLKLSNQLTFISKKSLDEALSLIALKRNKVSVVPNPYDPRFEFTPRNQQNEFVRILHVGTKPNKNLKRVLAAIKQLECQIHIVGPIDEDTYQELASLKIRFESSRILSDDDLLKAYKDSDVISFPSLYEGFGMPIIEAQATGRPVVTSNIKPMSEIAGEGAILVNPYSVDSIKDGFLKAIVNYEEIVAAGQKNVKQYNVNYVTDKYLEIYNKMIGNE